MRRNPFLSFQLTAERAGFPALLIVSAACLALVVVPVALLGLMPAGWSLALALLSLIAAIATLAGATAVALSDYDEPAPRRTDVDLPAVHPYDGVAPVPLHAPATAQDPPDQKAA
jgi:hypothetical protein